MWGFPAEGRLGLGNIKSYGPPVEMLHADRYDNPCRVLRLHDCVSLISVAPVYYRLSILSHESCHGCFTIAACTLGNLSVVSLFVGSFNLPEFDCPDASGF